MSQKVSILIFVLFFTSISASGNTCPFPCNGHPDTAFYAKHPRGCSWYFTCNVGIDPVEGRCPNKLLFNHQKQMCDFPENVDCPIVAEPITKCPDHGIMKIPHIHTCSKYTRKFFFLSFCREKLSFFVEFNGIR